MEQNENNQDEIIKEEPQQNKTYKEPKKKRFFQRIKDNHCIGIDLGTTNTIIYSKGEGVILREPSRIAIKKETKEVLAVGNEAKKMAGRIPENIIAISPLEKGVIADFDTTSKMIQLFIKNSCNNKKFSRLNVNVCAPYCITSVERRALTESIKNLGIKNVTLIEEPLAAAMGAGIDISEPIGSMVVDIGGGTTEIAVTSLGGIVIGVSTGIGGDMLDQSIIEYVKKEFNLLIGEKTAEIIKIEIGSVIKGLDLQLEIKGRDLLTGLPSSKIITSDNVVDAIGLEISKIISDIKQTLEKSPPELISDIITTGITLTGGGALLRGMDKLVEKETLVNVRVADNPLDCVAVGTGLSCGIIK